MPPVSFLMGSCLISDRYGQEPCHGYYLVCLEGIVNLYNPCIHISTYREVYPARNYSACLNCKRSTFHSIVHLSVAFWILFNLSLINLTNNFKCQTLVKSAVDAMFKVRVVKSQMTIILIFHFSLIKHCKNLSLNEGAPRKMRRSKSANMISMEIQWSSADSAWKWSVELTISRGMLKKSMKSSGRQKQAETRL